MKNIILKTLKTVAFGAFCFLSVPIARAAEYGDYKLFAHFNFENGANDVLGNVKATGIGLKYDYDSDLGMNVMSFDAADMGNLQLNTNPVKDEMTVSLWFNRQDIDETACWRMIFSWYAPDGSSIYLTPRTSWGDQVFLVADNKSYSDYKSLTMQPITLGKWVHFAIVFENSNILAYQDGVLVGTSRIIGGVESFGTTKYYFGNNPENNYSMSGKIGDLRIYHEALSANQVLALSKKEEVPPAAPLDDANAPFAQISFDGNVCDSKGNISFESNVECTTSADHRLSGLFVSDSYISSVQNPVGDENYTVAMLYRTEKIEEENVADKTILKFKSDNGDYVALVSRYDEGKLKLECENSIDGEVKKFGLVDDEILRAKWNSIALAQSYASSGKGIARVYVNGKLCKSFLSFSTKDVKPVEWVIGDREGNALNGYYSDIRFYTRELEPEEMAAYHAGNTNSILLSVDWENEKQTIRNFGASDGWNGQTVGLYFTEEQKEEIAELLFSKDFDEEGNPKGIGLSSWRFNIGAGTAEQGVSSRITDETRRTECFLNEDGTYDWNKQAGQRALLELAVKKYGVDQIIGWQNSPPVKYTKRGLGFREYGDPKSTILKPEHYRDFGKFLAIVIEHFAEEGINFDYISPLNEPQFDWTCDKNTKEASQEGSPWSNQEIHDVVTAINDVFVERGIKTKIFITESGNISYHLKGSTGFASNQLETFWGKGSLNIYDLPSVSSIVSSHSYWTDTDDKTIVDKRKSLRDEMNALDPNLEYWQTEYSLLNTGYRFGHNSEILSPIQSAISLARIIHADLALANATGWQWWTTFELEKFLNTEDRFSLIRIALNSDKTAGVYNTTKLMYSLGNFSFFIRPGMKRIELQRNDEMNDYDAVTNQMFSAYKDEETGRLVIVAINASPDDCGISLPEVLMDNDMYIRTYVPYITSGKDGDELKRYDEVHAGQHYVMPGYSIITFVAEPEAVSSIDMTVNSDNVKVYPNPAVDYVSISSPETVESYTLYSLSGCVIDMRDVNNQEFGVNVANLQSGVYILRMKLENSVVTKKIVVSNRL